MLGSRIRAKVQFFFFFPLYWRFLLFDIKTLVLGLLLGLGSRLESGFWLTCLILTQTLSLTRNLTLRLDVW